MKLVAPDYYSDFKCIADECVHSCCVGWEIDIDEESYERFMKLPGEIGERVRKSISVGEDGPYFHMTNDGKCPFLNANGLCDMIIEMGEDCLCQICDDHPRFRNFWGDREEIGLGLCCEAAGMLILGRKECVKEVVLDDDCKNDVLSDEEEEILEYRRELIDVIQDRSMPVIERVKCILDDLNAGENVSFQRWGRF
ncbi:MAG: flagellin lysine-N-methylase, partial [Clostridia bacterium]|nr:flagellin lysine-N-methylase [Clostridia bacterium]